MADEKVNFRVSQAAILAECIKNRQTGKFTVNIKNKPQQQVEQKIFFRYEPGIN